MEFSENLELIRKDLKLKSHKQFHAYLNERGLGINYQHFMKIVKGQQRATPEIASQLAAILQSWSDDLILSYCQDLFKKQKHLFTKAEPQKPDNSKSETSPRSEGVPTLTHLQVECLAQNKQSYYLFIIGTLSRRPMPKTELKRWFKEDELDQALGKLLKAKVFVRADEGFQTFSTEIRFPEKDSQLDSLYRKLDIWDIEFSNEMKFETILTKKIIRRISPRYFGLLRNHFELIFESVKASDEIDIRHNSDVIQLAVSLSKGKLPG